MTSCSDLPHVVAHRWHSQRCTETPFDFIVEAHAQGIILSTPSLFFLARRLSHLRPHSTFSDVTVTDPHGSILHVWLAAGKLDRALIRNLIPDGVRFLSWHRGDRLSFYPLFQPRNGKAAE